MSCKIEQLCDTICVIMSKGEPIKNIKDVYLQTQSLSKELTSNPSRVRQNLFFNELKKINSKYDYIYPIFISEKLYLVSSKTYQNFFKKILASESEIVKFSRDNILEEVKFETNNYSSIDGFIQEMNSDKHNELSNIVRTLSSHNNNLDTLVEQLTKHVNDLNTTIAHIEKEIHKVRQETTSIIRLLFFVGVFFNCTTVYYMFN